MIRTRSVLVALAAALASASAHAGQDVQFGPAPDWVEPHPVPPPGDGAGDVPVRTLLLDNQVRMENGRRAIYSAFALKFQTSDGLSAAGNLSLPWQAETDELVVHKVLIHRGGETIDVLASGQTFTVLRREQNLEQAMLDGVLTANMFPEGLQVGDVLEVATTRTVANPAFGEHDEVLLGPMNAPIDRAYTRLTWPQGEAMRLARTEGMPEPKRTRQGGFETAEVALADVRTIPLPEGAPPRFAFIGFLEASDFASWSALAAHFAPLYAQAAQLPAEGPLRAEVERIRAASSDPAAQAEAALALVQGRVRYVALAMGEGGLVPADAALTWSRRYGDCKGKTALLLAILGELGIRAEPVFVNTVIGDALPERLPMIGMFDHVLVRAHIGGREYWLDGTRTGDTSLARLRTPGFDWGLPVVAGGAELVRMSPAPLETPDEDLVVHMDGSKGLKAPLPARVELTLRGDSAIGTNQVLTSLVGEARDRSLREYWRNRFDYIEPEKVGFTFDEAAGELRMTLEGLATLEWNGVWYETDETAVGFQADFKREAGPHRDAPYAVAYPFYNRSRQTIVLPTGSNFNGNDFSAGAEVAETVAGIEYRRHAAIENDAFVVERTTRSVAQEFAAGDAPAFEKRLRDLRDRRLYLRLPNTYAGTEADRAVAVAPAANDFDAILAEGNDLLDAGQHDEALARFTRATELAPGNANAWAHRGITLAWKRAFAEAQVDLNRAVALDPRNAVAFRGRGLAAEMQRDFPAALAAYGTAIEIDPASSFAWGHRAIVHLANNQPDRALADAGKALELWPQYVEMYSVRALVLMGKGQRDAAGKEVDAMLAANPDNPFAASVAGDMLRMLGREGEARALVERSASTRPTPMALFQRSEMRPLGDTAGRLADLDESLRMEPGFGPSLTARAMLRAATGDADGALADAAASLRLNPEQRHLYVLQANVARGRGRTDEAVAAIDAMLATNPQSTPALVQASRIYAGLGMYADAVATVDKALAEAPEPYLYLDRAAARDPADFDARLADIDAALKRSPKYAQGVIAKAQLLAERGDTAGAVRVFGQALALQPGNLDVITRRGIALAKAGRPREAERDFAQARTLANGFGAAALNAICYAKATAGVALERALDECQAALRLQPDFAPTLDSRGTVYLQMGRLEEAIADFDKVIEKMPAIAQSRYLRGVARSRGGDAAGAAADILAGRTADPKGIADLERQGLVPAQESRPASEPAATPAG